MKTITYKIGQTVRIITGPKAHQLGRIVAITTGGNYRLRFPGMDLGMVPPAYRASEFDLDAIVRESDPVFRVTDYVEVAAPTQAEDGRKGTVRALSPTGGCYIRYDDDDDGEYFWPTRYLKEAVRPIVYTHKVGDRVEIRDDNNAWNGEVFYIKYLTTLGMPLADLSRAQQGPAVLTIELEHLAILGPEQDEPDPPFLYCGDRVHTPDGAGTIQSIDPAEGMVEVRVDSIQGGGTMFDLDDIRAHEVQFKIGDKVSCGSWTGRITNIDAVDGDARVEDDGGWKWIDLGDLKHVEQHIDVFDNGSIIDDVRASIKKIHEDTGTQPDILITSVEGGDAVQAMIDAQNNIPGFKETNPKDAVGMTKPGLWFIPTPVLYEVGLALSEGAMKYGGNNWRVAGVRASIYYDAVGRHLDAWKEGEDIDPESGIHHFSKAIAGLCVIRDAMINGKFYDDRPPKAPEGWMKKINEQFEGLRKRYPNPKKPHMEIDSD